MSIEMGCFHAGGGPFHFLGFGFRGPPQHSPQNTVEGLSDRSGSSIWVAGRRRRQCRTKLSKNIYACASQLIRNPQKNGEPGLLAKAERPEKQQTIQLLTIMKNQIILALLFATALHSPVGAALSQFVPLNPASPLPMPLPAPLHPDSESQVKPLLYQPSDAKRQSKTLDWKTSDSIFRSPFNPLQVPANE